MQQNLAIEMENISKVFGSLKANNNVNLSVRKGEVHALLGENGAGKSTLIKVLTGVEEFETGTIRMEGSSNTIINRSPQEAQENGISPITLGKRILRTETAGMAVLSVLMFQLEGRE